jgi:hypothetical protein
VIIRTGIDISRIIRRGVVVRIVKKRVIERVIGVIVRVVVIAPVRAAKHNGYAERGSVVPVTAETVAPGVTVASTVIIGIEVAGIRGMVDDIVAE